MVYGGVDVVQHSVDNLRVDIRRTDEKEKACRLVRDAVLNGNLLPAKLLSCTDCGKPAVLYDHRDYSKPLDVQPVCKSCNNKRGSAKNYIPFYRAMPMYPNKSTSGWNSRLTEVKSQPQQNFASGEKPSTFSDSGWARAIGSEVDWDVVRCYQELQRMAGKPITPQFSLDKARYLFSEDRKHDSPLSRAVGGRGNIARPLTDACRNGHPPNWKVYMATRPHGRVSRQRLCMTCHRLAAAARYRKKKAAALLTRPPDCGQSASPAGSPAKG